MFESLRVKEGGMKKLMFTLATATIVGLAQADDGTFTNAAGGNWSDEANWANGVIASGAGAQAKFSAELTNNVSVALPSEDGATIGSLAVENTSADEAMRTWTLTGALTLDKGETAASLVKVGANATLTTYNLGDVNDVIKTGVGRWNLQPSVLMFQQNSLIVRDGICHLANAGYGNAKFVLDPVEGCHPVLSIGSAEMKNNPPSITVKAGPGSPSIWAEPYGKNYTSSLKLERMVEFKTLTNQSGTFFGGGISGTGGIRKTGSGTLAFGAGPSIEGEIILSQGGISGGSSWWNNDKAIAVTIGDKDSETSSPLTWSFSEKGSLPGAKTTFHVAEYGGPVTFQWAKNQTGGTANAPFTLDRDVTFNANVNANCGNTFAGIISGKGGITFTGNGTDRFFRLTGANTYKGGTSINKVTVKVGTTSALGTGDVSIGATGKLAYDADGIDAIADAAVVRVTTGGVIDFGTHAVTEKVLMLTLDGVKQKAGIWGAVGSGATHEADWITGSGFLKVAGLGFTVSVR